MLLGIGILLCIFLGTNYFVIKNTHIFLNHQLASNSQDTATAMGLSLTLLMKNNEVATVQRIVDAIWDRGHYQSIIIQDSNQKVIASKSQQKGVTNIPTWFTEIFKLDSPKKEAVIMDGWQVVGKVIIEGNPAYGYQQIWLTFVDILKWLLLIAFLSIILGGLFLYIILRPLHAITLQAQAICNQQFTIQKDLPFTLDLRVVVKAMNTMSSRLKELFEEQVKKAQQFQAQAYTDPVTNLGNRRYFDLQFTHFLNDEEEAANAVLLIIQFVDFGGYNHKYGYVQSDILLQHAVNLIQSVTKQYTNAIVARNKTSELIILIPGRDLAIGADVASKITEGFSEFYHKNLSKELDVAHIGLTEFRRSESPQTILSRADMSLRSAQSKGPNEWYAYDKLEPDEIYGEMAWKKIFEEVIEQKKIILYYQEIKFWKSHQPSYEVLTRIESNNTRISAAIFVPMAQRLHLILSLDKQTIEKIVHQIRHHKSKIQYSLHLPSIALEDELFKAWVLQKLKELGKKAEQLTFQFSENAVVQHLEKVSAFFTNITSLGGLTAIDHCGRNFNVLAYLSKLKVNFIKIDGAYVKGIDSNQENQIFVNSLVNLAHSLGIIVVAKCVETLEEYRMLRQLQVDGMQGHYIGKPTDLDLNLMI